MADFRLKAFMVNRAIFQIQNRSECKIGLSLSKNDQNVKKILGKRGQFGGQSCILLAESNLRLQWSCVCPASSTNKVLEKQGRDRLSSRSSRRVQKNVEKKRSDDR
jgi:hypothetical protein